MYPVLESFCPQAGPALPFPIDEKEAIPRPRDVKTNPRPGVLTARALASIKGHTKIEKALLLPYLSSAEAARYID